MWILAVGGMLLACVSTAEAQTSKSKVRLGKRGSVVLDLTRVPSVRKALKLSEQQQSKLSQIQKTAGEAIQKLVKELRGKPAAQRRALIGKMSATRARAGDDVEKILGKNS